MWNGRTCIRTGDVSHVIWLARADLIWCISVSLSRSVFGRDCSLQLDPFLVVLAA